MPERQLYITPELAIPRSELHFQFGPSSGPGGQNVNRTATRVQLTFDIAASRVLTPGQREKILTRLAHRIQKGTVLSLMSQRTRSQVQNRQDVVDRFEKLIRLALQERRERRPGRSTFASRQRRLAGKRRRAEIKRQRRPLGRSVEE